MSCYHPSYTYDIQKGERDDLRCSTALCSFSLVCVPRLAHRIQFHLFLTPEFYHDCSSVAEDYYKTHNVDLLIRPIPQAGPPRASTCVICIIIAKVFLFSANL